MLHFESCSSISVICAAFQGLTERSSSGARGEFLPPPESAFFDTFFHASAERKYEETGVWPGSTATRRWIALENEVLLGLSQKPSQTPKLLLATKMFYAARGMNVSQVGADAEHLPPRDR